MRVRLLANVANDVRGDVITVSSEQGEKLIRTGYAVAVSDEPKKAKAA
jgi:hypothetical protein